MMLATAIGLGTLFAAAPAAQAAPLCCQLSLNGVPGQLNSGQTAGFTATFVNGSDRQISSLQLAFSFNGSNQLRGSNLDFEKLNSSGGWQRLSAGRHNGSLSVTDTRFRLSQPLAPGSQTTFQYRISFVNNPPSGNVGMSVMVSGRLGSAFGGGRSDNQQLAQAGPVQIAVIGVGAPPTATAKPQPSHPTPTPSVTDTSQVLPTDTPSVESIPSVDALPASGSGGGGTSGFMWLAYTFGALLLLAGIGVIGTMLWKRGPQIVESDWEDEGAAVDPYQPPAYGATTYGAPTTYGPGGAPQGPPPQGGGGGRHSLRTEQMPPQQMPPTQHMPRI